MNTEQRLRFEAKHQKPQGAEYDSDRNAYVTHGQLSECLIYNKLWQGYQSALEATQGEAVAISSCAAQECLSDLMAIAEKLPASEQQTNVMIAADKLRREIAILDEAFTTAKKLHIHCVSTLANYRTSPQPAQPSTSACGFVHKETGELKAVLTSEDGNEDDWEDCYPASAFALRKGA